MKQKNFWLRMIPVLILVAATAILSSTIYFQMINSEEEVCWNRLEIATNSTAQKIKTRITDNMNFLIAVADGDTLANSIEDVDVMGEFLNSIVEKTIFDRIDVILPDESLITQDGQSTGRGGRATYEELTEKGIHITQRQISSFTGEEVICCTVPIEKQDEVLGILVGTINCRTLSELFEVFTYGKAAQLFLIDRTDGSYLMDNWHEELGNVYDMGLRKSADSDEMIDMVPTIINGQRARFAYISRTNGEKSYQYCAPVEDFNWEVCVVVQEDVVFANVKALERDLLKAGLVELLVVLVYVLWNVLVNIAAIRSEEKVKRLEYEKAKNDARAIFLSNMSHDIRTPLNGIVGMLQIIKNHRSDQEMVDECLDKIGISARYLSTLTSDMLDINEIENDKLVLPEEPIDLHQLVSELTSLMERQAGEAGVSYAMDCSGLEHPHIVGSSVHIKRILVNLIGNAIKYSKNAGKNVWVTIFDESLGHIDGERLYRFVIRDNGIGMSEEFQRNMYKAFEQEHIDARSEYQGYGLGLTIVNHLVRKMGGTIELESVKNRGSTFTVSIPFQTGARAGDQETAGPGRADITGRRLLLVEDNEFNMEIANILLTDAGAAVDMAANGKLAVELFAESGPNTYDGIIMDVMMPVMDGCEATRVIRAMDRPDAKSVPVIAMTASTFSEDIARCMDAGMNAHIPKPLDVDQLMATIIQYCSGETRRKQEV